MYIVPMAWLYVALMMAVAEATNDNGTVLGGLITFVLYGLGPVLLVLYLMGSPARRKAIKATEAADMAAEAVPEPVQETAHSEAHDTVQPAPAQASGAPAPAGDPLPSQPDAGNHATAASQGHGVAPVRKEP